MPQRQRSRRRLTRRGHYLLSFGVVQLALAFTYGASDGTPGRELAQQVLPAPVYLVLSLAAGLLAVAAGVLRPTLERTAFGALAAVAAARCLANLAAVVFHQEAPLLTGTLAFGLLLRVHLLVAGWPEPTPPVVVSLTQEQLEALAEELRRRAAGGDA